MRCKKCNSELTYDSKFCPYCGEAINKENNTYDDPFKDIRINSHDSQYNYQNKYSNGNIKNKSVKKNNELNPYPKDNKSLIGLILGILAIPLAIFNAYFGIPVAVIGFILTIVGLKHTSKAFGIIALVLNIFNLILAIIITVFMLVGNIVINFSNGYETSIKDYITDAFFCGLNEYSLEGYWVDEDNRLFYLDDEEYYFYLDKESLLDNYYYGYYEVEGGIELKPGEKLYGDEKYYYYQFTTTKNKSKIDGIIHFQNTALLSKDITLKLDKNTKKKLVMVLADEKEIEFTKR